MSMRARVLYFFLLTAMLHQTAAIRCRAQVAAQPVEFAAAIPSVVPQAMRFSGVAVNRAGDTLEAVFRIYAEPEGGEPLWSETQRIAIDRDGNYSVLLGAATEGGLPQSLFASGKPRWLGISMERASELPRVALVSVAYAMKAADAETLSGIPAADFVTQAQLRKNTAEATAGNAGATSSAPVHPGVAPTGSGTADTIPIWKTSSTLGNSILTQTTSGVTAKGSLSANSATAAAAIGGTNSYAKGAAFGVSGIAASPVANSAGVNGVESSKTGQVYGVSGTSYSTTLNSAGVYGSAAATTGQVYGVGGVSSSKTALSAGVGGEALSATGQVYGVFGVDQSDTALSAGVAGLSNAASGEVFGVLGVAKSSTQYAAGVSGLNKSTTGQVYGVSGTAASSTTNGTGVAGYESATTGQVYGVDGYTASTGPSAAAVGGFEGAATGVVYGVVGGASSTSNGAAGVNGSEAATTGAVYGVAGYSASSGGTGVFGSAYASSGFTNGVSGHTASPNGNGVFGQASSTSGGNGVSGTANSANGNGVLGSNNATSGFAVGVTGFTTSPNGAGVNGFSSAATGGIGVNGNAGTSGTAILGGNQNCSNGSCTYAAGTALALSTGSGGTLISASTGTAGSAKSTAATQEFSVDAGGNGFFNGNLDVTGKLTKGSGSFKIDHPLDPANRYLYHSFVESPDMMNVYNGNVTTDKHGEATVVLPDYFQALNRDFRYQLTVIGQFAQAIVATKIANNRFVIRTSKPHVEVSWQVTGIRQDAYANANRIPVEEEKPETERGYYLHPELFGQPAGKSLSASRRIAGQPNAASADGR